MFFLRIRGKENTFHIYGTAISTTKIGLHSPGGGQDGRPFISANTNSMQMELQLGFLIINRNKYLNTSIGCHLNVNIDEMGFGYRQNTPRIFGGPLSNRVTNPREILEGARNWGQNKFHSNKYTILWWLYLIRVIHFVGQLNECRLRCDQFNSKTTIFTLRRTVQPFQGFRHFLELE